MTLLSIEESTLKSWPALESELYDGWVLRFANGYTGRSNSVLPLYSSSLDVEAKIDYCEAQYRHRGLPSRFRMLPESHPANLDELLEKRGYRRENDSWVMTLDMAQSTPVEIDERVRFNGEFTDEWAQSFCRLNTAQSSHLESLRRLLPTIQLPTCYASVIHDGEIAAVALTVRDGDKIGVYDVATRTDLRAQGFGKILVGSVLAQAQNSGVSFAYLQMLQSNTPAYRLYSGFGFREVYAYWYRSLH